MATKDITDRWVLLAYVHSRKVRDEDPEAVRKGWWAMNVLMEETGECWKVCYRAVERAYSRRLIDCGVSLRCGWITPKGHAFLASGKQNDVPDCTPQPQRKAEERSA